MSVRGFLQDLCFTEVSVVLQEVELGSAYAVALVEFRAWLEVAALLLEHGLFYSVCLALAHWFTVFFWALLRLILPSHISLHSL